MNPDRLSVIAQASFGMGLVLLVGAVCMWSAVIPRSDSIIQAAVEGRSIDFVNTYIRIHRSLDPEHRTLEYFQRNGGDVLIRFAFVLSCAGSGFLFFRKRISKRLGAFFAATEGPEPLALFRIAVGGAILSWVTISPVLPFLALPEEFLKPPPGLSWTSSFFPLEAPLVLLLQFILGISALMVVAGFQTGRASILMAGAALVVMGIPQFYGKIDHYHHLVWFSVLLAVSPSGDAWSLDAMIRRRTGVPMRSAPSTVYALPIRVALILVGMIYLFPGIWKFIIGGTGWGGETMRYQMYAKWMSIDWIPAFRMDQLPALMTIVGTGVVVFEIAFLFLVLSDRWRPWIAFGGILFHISVYFLMHINFWTLIVCYVVFIDGRLLTRCGILDAQDAGRAEDRVGTSEGRWLLPMGGGLLCISLISGISLLDTWPVAVYPTFAGVPEPNAYVLTFSTVDADGERRDVRPLMDKRFRSQFGPSRAEGLVHQIVWEQDTIKRARKAERLFEVVSGLMKELQSAERVTIFRDRVPVKPSMWSTLPLRREVLKEIVQVEGGSPRS